MRAWLLIVVLAGCGGGLKRHSSKNAPGNVDLDTPPPPSANVSGNPDWYEVPADPGEHALGVAPGASALLGVGRVPTDEVMVELSAQLHVSYGQRRSSLGRGAIGYPWNTWGVTLGWSVVQISDNVRTSDTTDSIITVGPIFAELTRQWYLLSASAGLAVYPTPGEVAGGAAEGVDPGGQITLGCEPFGVRARYVQDSGFEIMGGYQLFLPTSVTWSR